MLVEKTANWLPEEYNLARELNKMIFKYHPHDGKTQITILPNKKVVVVASFCKTPKNILEDLCRNFFRNRRIQNKRTTL